MQEQEARKVGRGKKKHGSGGIHRWVKRLTSMRALPKLASFFHHIPVLDSDSQPGSPTFVAVRQNIFRGNHFRDLRLMVHSSHDPASLLPFYIYVYIKRDLNIFGVFFYQRKKS